METDTKFKHKSQKEIKHAISFTLPWNGSKLFLCPSSYHTEVFCPTATIEKYELCVRGLSAIRCGGKSKLLQLEEGFSSEVLAAFPPLGVAAVFHRQVIPPVMPFADSPPYLKLSLRDRTFKLSVPCTALHILKWNGALHQLMSFQCKFAKPTIRDISSTLQSSVASFISNVLVHLNNSEYTRLKNTPFSY